MACDNKMSFKCSHTDKRMIEIIAYEDKLTMSEALREIVECEFTRRGFKSLEVY